MRTHARTAPPERSSTIRGAGAAAVVLLAAACGSGYVPASQAVPVGSQPSAAVQAPPSDAGGLATASTTVGTVVTSEGYTLTASPGHREALGVDLRRPVRHHVAALLGDGVPAVDGLSADLVGTVGRSDGTQQLTLNGWPLYRFAKDAEPGDVNGQGVGGTWQAIGPDGKPAAAPAPDPAPAHDTGGSSGY